MMKTLWFGLFLIAVSVTTFRVESREPESLSLQKILEKEAKGVEINRAMELKGIGPESANDAIRWQSGELREKDQWIPVDAIGKQDASNDSLLERYRKERGQATLNLEGHLRMARWCAEHKLRDQEVAHWNGVLGFVPDHPLSHERLGDTFIGGRWFSKEDLEVAKERSQQLSQDFRTWMPKCREIVRKLNEQDASSKKKGLASLESIDDPDAIPSLEMIAMQFEDATSLPFVSKICEFHTHEACMALVRLAILDPNVERGRIAIEGVKKYPFDLYVPELLSLVKTEDKVSTTYHLQPNGSLVSRTLLFREMKDTKHVHELTKVLSVRLPRQVRQRPIGQGVRSTSIPVSAIHPVAFSSLVTTTAHDQSRAEDLVRNANRLQDEESLPIFQVLNQATGAKVEPKAEAWWKWWNQEYSYTVPAEKKVYRTAERAYAPVLVDAPAYTVEVRPRCECLVRGTPIQTEFGLKAIEEIRIGDRVVSQDIETGELAMKPVLQTTVRNPEGTLRLKTATDEIEATNGHTWWVAGYGWLRTKQLQPGMALHTTTGVSPIVSIEEKPTPVVTYNLVVDDFHTYFVGKERVLSYDNTEVKGTLKTVPGISLEASKP